MVLLCVTGIKRIDSCNNDLKGAIMTVLMESLGGPQSDSHTLRSVLFRRQNCQTTTADQFCCGSPRGMEWEMQNNAQERDSVEEKAIKRERWVINGNWVNCPVSHNLFF